MVLSSSTTRSEGNFPQRKCKGIHEPKGRVKGFRVEIRPPGSSLKIWVGTFDTRGKAMRAFDAAVYLTGKEPHYFVYPDKYFPSRISNLPKEEVQKQAKLLAEKTDDLERRSTSVHGDHLKTVESQKASNVVDEQTNLNTTDDKKSLDTPLASEFWPAELDDQLHGAPYMNLPDELPCSDWISHYFAPSQEESKADLAPIQEDSKVDFAPVQEIEDYFEVSAFLEGCEDESFIVDSKPPLKVASKRKRDVIEGGGAVTNARKNMGFSEAGGGGAANDGWLSTMVANDPSQFIFFPRVWDSNPCSDDSDDALVAIC